MAFIHHAFYFFVDGVCYGFTVVAVATQVTTQEYLVIVVIAECDGAQFVGHPPFCHHAANDACSALDIVGCAGTDFVQHQFFCYTAAQHHNYLLTQVCTCHIVAILGRQEQSVTACTAAWNNRYFVYRVFTRQEITAQCMPCFVVAYQILFIVAHFSTGFLFRPCNYTFNGLLQLLLTNFFQALTCG